MFLTNKYSKAYFKIIKHYKEIQIEGYFERHHIVPKSLGGSHDKSNIVELPAKAHFVCHHLLTKMTTDQDKIKMIHAFWRMIHAPQHSQPITAKVYQVIKEERAKALSKEMQGKNNKFYGKKHSNDTKQIMSQKAKQRVEEYGAPIGGFRKGNKSWNTGLSKNSSSVLKKLSESRKGENNPMFGRSGKDHPNTISFTLHDSQNKEVKKFDSRISFFDYCQKNNLPFNGLYKTLKNKERYKDGSKNGKFKSFNGWFLISDMI
jgi:hypothetical protein